MNNQGEQPEEAEYGQTALIQINPETDPRVTALYDESVKLLDYAKALVITSDADIQSSTNDLSIIAGLKKAIDERRQEYVRPLNEHLKTVNSTFKDFTQPLSEADALTRQKILTYRAEQERIRAEQERINALRMEAAQAEMELKGEITEPVNLTSVQNEPPNMYRANAGTLGTSKTWRFEMVDFAILPDEYKLPDTTKIRKVIQAGASVPGVKAWQEEGLRVTPRSATS